MQTAYRQLQSMGTNMDLVFPGAERSLCDHMADKIRRELDRIERRLSVYWPDSDISMINRAGFKELVHLDEEISLIFIDVFTLHEDTGGFLISP